jgi:gas vesicle protein
MKTEWMFCAGLTGLAAGVFLGLALAPQSGKETRELVKEKTREGFDELAAKGKKLAARSKEQVSDALEAGQRAFQDAVARG